MSLCLFFSPSKSFFSSKTEINDENVDRKKFEMYDLVEFWKMDLEKGLRKRNLMKPEVYGR